MRKLYHHWLNPFCRKIRVQLAEKTLEHQLVFERVWTPRPEFLTINPAGCVPVLEEDDGTYFAHSDSICEYLEEKYPEKNLLGVTPQQRAEVRRLVGWFDNKFMTEVTTLIVNEKALKRLHGKGYPEPSVIRQGIQNLHVHLKYMESLVHVRNWLAGDHFSMADIAAGAHISCIDYLGDVPWEQYPEVKGWYERIKSRPSFRSLLEDVVPGITPAAHYTNLDF